MTAAAPGREDSAHPGLTITVYRIGSWGRRVVVRPERTYEPGADDSVIANPVGYPPCECPRCRPDRREGAR